MSLVRTTFQDKSTTQREPKPAAGWRERQTEKNSNQRKNTERESSKRKGEREVEREKESDRRKERDH